MHKEKGLSLLLATEPNVFSSLFSFESLKVVSKCQISFDGKASRKLKAERTRQYVSISIWGKAHLLNIKLKGHPAMLDNAAIERKMAL